MATKAQGVAEQNNPKPEGEEGLSLILSSSSTSVKDVEAAAMGLLHALRNEDGDDQQCMLQMAITGTETRTVATEMATRMVPTGKATKAERTEVPATMWDTIIVCSVLLMAVGVGR
uniref:Uncharacterized protein n=1 Tax=Pseudictyota dubia TaxID=2749911 RepID=A0A7R9W850_9STRA|mmetsp:Transcript_38264/g.70652  ORF Transcript_38264/g.70652 Transcript_38264/m.70652 type:complete len:116 (+) Transcript_38264:642-989(+)